MKLFFSVIISAFLFTSSINWELDFEKAKTEASQSNKFILLSFGGSDWCAPCIKLKEEIFESFAFQKYAKERLIMVRADFPRLKKNQLDAKQIARNEALAEKYNPEGKFPFTLLLDAKGKKLKEWDGYPKNLTPALMMEQITVASK
jgi:thioredoxin-related protein